MSHLLEIGEPPVAVIVRRSARARRLSLRVSRLDGRVTLTMPSCAGLHLGEVFVRERLPWIREQLSQLPVSSSIQLGAHIPVRGVSLQIVPAEVRVPQVEGDRLLVSNAFSRAGLRAWLREQARADLSAASARYSERLGRPFSKITLRDTRSRWGSCSSRGDLMYSWRLVLAPPDVLEYVAAHEVAHLQEMNHSPAFWAVVERLRPTWRRERDWLREHGASLHAYRFED